MQSQRGKAGRKKEKREAHLVARVHVNPSPEAVIQPPILEVILRDGNCQTAGKWEERWSARSRVAVAMAGKMGVGGNRRGKREKKNRAREVSVPIRSHRNHEARPLGSHSAANFPRHRHSRSSPGNQSFAGFWKDKSYRSSCESSERTGNRDDVPRLTVLLRKFGLREAGVRTVQRGCLQSCY